jgi:hypothetical protein
MKKCFTLALFAFLFSHAVSGQWSIGARFGGASGVSLKHYPANSTGLLFEGITALHLDENAKGFNITLMLEKFGPLSSDGKLGAIAGVGETMLFPENDFQLGISGILGFDWRLGRRIGVQLDWLPSYIFVGDSYFSSINAAFTARWIFGGR